MLEVVKRAGKDQEHLLVQARDVVPNHEDDSTELPCDRDSVLRVHLLLLFRLTGSHQVPVDDARLNCTSQLNENLAI